MIERALHCGRGHELDELDLKPLAETCVRAGVELVRFPIVDRGLPSEAAIRALARTMSERVAKGESVAVHCRQGIGRSSLICAAILVCLAAARGRPVPDTPEQSAWLEEFAARA